MAQHDSTPSLQRAVDSGNWVAVNDLLDDRHVDKAVIEKSGLLPKLVTNRVISLTLMEDIVGKICSHHVSLNSLDEEGMGVLHRLSMGSETERHDVLFLLLSNGADINLTNIDNDTPLHVAAKYRNLRMMLALLRRGTKGDLANKEKRTVLHIFVDCFPSTNILSQKCVDNIFTLLKKTSLSIDATDCEGNTALHVAVRRGQSLIAEKLLTVGARADVVNADGKTVLHIMATEKHKYSSSFWERIVKCGAKIEIKDLEGNTAFRLASILENWDFLKMFTDIFINETEENQNNYFFNDELRAAVEGRRWNVVKWIVKYSTDINTPDSQGRTLLQTLAQFNSDKNVDDTFCLLVEMGADITVRTRKGENLLQLSVRHNNWLVAERLVRTGFGFCELDSEGRLGLLHRLLEQKAKQPTSLLILLCKYATNIVNPTQSGDTLLHLAAKHGNIAVVKYLVRKSSRKTLNKLDSEGFSILHRIVKHLYEESRDCSSREPPLLSVVNLLLSKGADPLCQSSTGDTILHFAAKHNHWDIVYHLVELEFGVSRDDSEGLCLLHRLLKCQEEDSNGHSPLSLAIKQRIWNYVLVLLQHVAEVNVNVDNKSILHFIISKHKDIPHTILTHLLDAMQTRGVDFNTQDYTGRTILFEYEVYSTVSCREDPSGSLFRLLVDRGANPLVADRNGHSLLRFALDLNEGLALNFVKFLVGTGITTHQPTLTEAAKTFPASSSSLSMPSPTQAAFEVKNVQAFKLLVESGASANRELFELSAQYEAKYVVRHKTKAETQMMDILNQAASQPRSLKSLCRLTVSHALGCGLRRREMILTLPIPPSLQEYILFSDILSEEFVTSEDEVENQNMRFLRINFGRRILDEQLYCVGPLCRFPLVDHHIRISYFSPLLGWFSFKDPVVVSAATQPALTSSPAQEPFRHRADRAAKCSHPARAKQHVKNFVRVQSLSRPRRFLADRGVPPPHTLSRSPHQRKRVTERNH